MRKLFFRYFIGIFSITVITLLIQASIVLSQYTVSQNQWRDDVYQEFADSLAEKFETRGLSAISKESITSIVNEISNDRVSGYVIRDTEGRVVYTQGFSPRGYSLSYSFPSNQKVLSSQGGKVVDNVRNASRISITGQGNMVYLSQDYISSSSIPSFTIPENIGDNDVIGSIIFSFEGRDLFILDLMTYSPLTYAYTRDVMSSCGRALLISIPICLLVAIILAWFISSTNAHYISSIRDALNDLSKGKANVKVKKSGIHELSDITNAIEHLDKSLQSNVASRKAWLRSISHDLNTPVASMKVLLDGINDGIFPMDKESLLALQGENDKLAMRIEKVITYSKLQADIVPTMESVNTSSFTQEVLEKIDSQETVSVQLDTEEIVCDSSLMTRCCTEVLNNALDVSQNVQWNIGLKDDYYSMTISNEGSLPKAMVGEAFLEPWTRGDWGRTQGGSGLGLPIAATIVALHNGKLELKEEDNRVFVSITWPKNLGNVKN
ncbi:MAG: HAMP domain-containing histidine kinase [Sphaerochaetaceae bacterium]|nr:HAMP domain-containing histidine kinase [Sphaerochaetaceae bacterium]